MRRRFIVKTINGGSDWNIIYEGTVLYDSFKEIGVIDSTNIWIASLYSLYHSKDARGTWINERTNDSLGIRSAVFFDDNNIILAGGSGYGADLILTTDAGNSWIAPTGLPDNTMFNSIDFIDDNTGFVGDNSGTIYTSID